MKSLLQRGAAVDIQTVGKSFPGGIVALQPTNLTIPAGEVLVLLGPSGCGKTTLLRLIAGLEAPDPGGTICFDGEDITGRSIERRQIGMVFQSYALFPNMTVAENIGYGLKVRKIPSAERRAEVSRLLDMVGLTELANRRIDRISGGQRQRVALARAVAIKPRVLLLDEPLSALDAALRERLRIELAGLLQTFGITAVYVTHDQAEAMAIGDRIAVMNRGRIVQIGSARAIYSSPSSSFVAEFVGTMNRISGPVIDGKLRLSAGSLDVGGPERTTTFWFRPEAVSLLCPDVSPEQGLNGSVISSTFLGPICRLSVSLGHDLTIVIDVPGWNAVPVGAPIRVALSPTALVEIPEESDSQLC